MKFISVIKHHQKNLGYWNYYDVSWLSISFSRNLKDLSKLLEKSNGNSISFNQFARLQLGVNFYGVDIGMFFSVTREGIDRQWLHDNIDKPEVRNEIVKQINNLKDKGYVWDIWNIGGEEHHFEIDTHTGEEFIDFFEMYDRDGMYSNMLKRFKRNDPKINCKNIENTCLDVFKELYPLYMAMVWKV